MKKFFALALASLVLGGCTSMNTESVCVSSAPAGAEVFVGGEKAEGVTPMSLCLDKSVPHQLVIKKDGYKDEAITLSTTASDPFVKFGPFVDAGYYKQLTPDPVSVKLLPDFLPANPGDKKFEGLTQAVLKADQLKKDGKITPEEHVTMVETIIEFYAPGMKCSK